ncbi:S-type pyocin domain-containing protein [Pseudomonas nicosulfuronedens]
MRALACLGDKTTFGEIISATATWFEGNKPIAQRGDLARCDKCKGIFPINGTAYEWSEQQPYVATGDRVLCRCPNHVVYGSTTQYTDSLAPTNAASAPGSNFSPPVVTPVPAPAAKSFTSTPTQAKPASTFAKCCKLPDSVIDYSTAQGTFPVGTVSDYGKLVLLGGREVDNSGKLQLNTISGNVPPGFGSLALRGLSPGAGESCGGLCDVASAGGAVASGGRVIVGGGGRVVGGGILTGGVVGGALLGVVAMLWPSSLGDSALYTEEQLRTMRQARTRVRIRVEEKPDGTLKGYGYNTQLRSDWETIPVVQFAQVGSQMVADFGGGVELIWTPAATPSDTLGIPALEAAPQAPQITIYPPVEQADNLIVNPIYPPDYRDFILVFPAGSGIAPLYIVMNARHDPGTVTGAGKDVSGIWLAGAGEGLGAPIPKEVADQLRGKGYNSFDSFRRALWKSVARSSSLIAQFTDNNVDRMREGKSPKARYKDRAGRRSSFELHHIEEVAQGGKVYDVDNLAIVTPKNHIDIHRGK